MLVVADTSPFIALIKIRYVDVLPVMFHTVVIPPEVAAELTSGRRPQEVQTFIASPPSWLIVRAPSKIEAIAGIDPGEEAAINLACELNADLLLIDETKGREAAIERRLRVARTAAVLFDAANAGILPDLKTVFERLRKTNFRVPSSILDQLLKRHEEIRASSKK